MNSFKHPIDQNSNIKINELWLQYLWKKNIFINETLFTTTGKSLQIQFPGWFNNSWGPDFKESRIIVDGTSYFGDIELHIDEAAWHQHSHHLSEPYNKVVLHVFLNSTSVSAKNTFNHSIPSLCLKSDFLDSFWESYSLEPGFQIIELPGACGLSLDKAPSKRLKLVIQQAAETRMINKSQPFIKVIKNDELSEIENVLFTSICKSLGYSAHKELLVKISQLFPYSYLKNFFSSLQRQNRVEILSRWFGYLGVFDHYEINSLHEDLRKEWIILMQKWNQVGIPQPIETRSPKAPYRPYNNPVRRLIGLYYHLQSTHFKGLFGTWLRFLNDCQTGISAKRSRSIILEALDKMFPQPNWDPFSYFNPPSKKKESIEKSRFIGKQKQLIILVNSIIPFFLAWSRIHNDQKLEKLLFRMLLILPGEGKNSKINFMENRLFKGIDTIKLKHSLGYCQGLIQIHDDCCISFYEGCRQCTLLKWLHKTD